MDRKGVTIEQEAQAPATCIGSSRIGSEAHRKASGSKISSGVRVAIALGCNAASTRRQARNPQPTQKKERLSRRGWCDAFLYKMIELREVDWFDEMMLESSLAAFSDIFFHTKTR